MGFYMKTLLGILKGCGVGRKKLDNRLFLRDEPPPRLGVYDLDEETLCHIVLETKCSVPGCQFVAENLLEAENHYNSSHRYACSLCKKVLPSPHFLDLHLQEKHDSFFAVLSKKIPMYACYIYDCEKKFTTADERHEHSVQVHKIPKNFRYEDKTCLKPSKLANSKDTAMEVDETTAAVSAKMEGSVEEPKDTITEAEDTTAEIQEATPLDDTEAKKTDKKLDTAAAVSCHQRAGGSFKKIISVFEFKNSKLKTFVVPQSTGEKSPDPPHKCEMCYPEFPEEIFGKASRLDIITDMIAEMSTDFPE